ncbi:unnamed protein product [Prunus brigantina]
MTQYREAVRYYANSCAWLLKFVKNKPNKQKGLGRAIEDLVLAAKHIHCVRHLHANFRTTSRGSLALKQRLWAAAKATTVPW